MRQFLKILFLIFAVLATVEAAKANTSYHRPLSLTLQGSPAKKLDFQYNADNQRRMTLYSENNALVKTMYYVGNYEKEVIEGGDTNEYDYIYSPEGLAAIAVKTNNARSLYYAHVDHLGSLRVVTTPAKAIQTRYHYDAWGSRTLVAGTSLTNRGFTGHEHLPEFGFINANARLYDPVLGRFLNFDNFVVDGTYTQDFNRYTYARNNPLIYTDPMGEKWWHWILGDVLTGGLFSSTALFTAHNISSLIIGGAGMGLSMPLTTASTALSSLQAMSVSFSATATIIDHGVTFIGSFFNGPEWAGRRFNNSIKISGGLFQTDENKGLWGNALMLLSRWTWESPQTFGGKGYTHLRNAFGDIDRVDYLGGATFGTNENSGGYEWGITIGNYININTSEEITGSFQDWVTTHPMYMHEYGHTIDSRAWGPLYLLAIGAPSLLSAANARPVQGLRGVSTHDFRVYEMRANRNAAKYFKRYGVVWNSANDPFSYPFFMPRKSGPSYRPR